MTDKTEDTAASALLSAHKLLSEGKAEAASAELRRSLESGDLAKPQAAFARRLLAHADPANALTHLSDAEAVCSCVSNEIALATYHYKTKNWSECYRACQNAIAGQSAVSVLQWWDDPRSNGPYLHELASFAAWNLDDFDAAHQHALHACELAPNDNRLREYLTAMRTKTGRLDEPIAPPSPHDFICYVKPDWRISIRPAEPARPWMEATTSKYAYRCLPLTIANAHGWEILNPIAFEAYWNGGPEIADVIIRSDDGGPKSHFGHASLTFDIPAVFRTSPGWNLWVGGSPNRPKDGIYPLTGLIETDWSNYSFTMNWLFTRPDHIIRFEVGEPICFVFPIQRGVLDNVTPRFATLKDHAEREYDAFDKSRNTLLKSMSEVTRAPGDTWEKRYYRGLTIDDQPRVKNHQTKLRLRPFVSETR